MTTPRFFEVECLRGLAISLVVVHHVNGLVYRSDPSALVMLPQPLAAIVLTGYTGVDLFFVLSGFLLSRPFVAEARGGPVVDRTTYAVRRALRVMPLYVVAIAGAILDVATRPRDVLHGVPYLFFLNALPGGATRLIPHSDPWWSLATEAQFYVLLPFLPLLLRSARGRLVGAVLLVAYAGMHAALSRRLIHAATFEGDLALAQSVVGRGPLFLAGIVGGAVYDRNVDRLRHWAARHATGSRLVGDVVLAAALLGLLVLLGWAARRDYVARELVWPLWHVVEGVLWTTVLLALLLLPGSLKRLLANRGWAFLGLISYSLYLVHYPVVFYGRRFIIPRWPSVFPWGPERWIWTWTGLAGASVLLASAVALATLTYVAIERPMLRLKGRVPT